MTSRSSTSVASLLPLSLVGVKRIQYWQERQSSLDVEKVVADTSARFITFDGVSYI
jgi:hypothetical protein